MTTAAPRHSSRPGPLLPARSSSADISTAPASPLPKTPPHPHLLTDGKNRGKTEQIVRKDGITYYRKPRTPKPPKDRKVVKAARAYTALRRCGQSPAEISEQIGLPVRTLQTYVKFAAKNGWLTPAEIADPVDRLEEVISHTVVDNIEKVLTEKERIVIDKESGETMETDRLSDRAVKMTNDVAHGIGLLKTHQVSKTEGQTSVGVALKVDVVMPPAGTAPPIRLGSFGGTPAFDAEIIETSDTETR